MKHHEKNRHRSDMHQLNRILMIAIVAIAIAGGYGAVMKRITLLRQPPDFTRVVDENIYDPSKDASVTAPFPMTTIEQTIFPDLTCRITDYGAVPDGTTKNTAAFARAIDDCAGKGGGHVLVPAGKWLTGPIHYRSNIDLHLDQDAEIVFSTDYDDYLPVVFSRFEGVEYENFSPPVYANGVRHIALTGSGTLNGSGRESWWTLDILKSVPILFAMGKNGTPVSERVFGTPDAGLRPTFIEFVNCRNVLIDGVTLTNGPMWTMHPLYTSDMIVRHVTVHTAPGRSTDGIDIDSSRNVLVEDSSFTTGDDAIVIKSGRDQDGWRVGKPSENIVIRRNAVRDSHAAFAIGSEISGGVRNVLVYGCSFADSQYGIRLKGTLLSGGIVENISVQDIAMDNIDFEPIQITTNYETDLNVPPFTPPTFRDIDIRNIRASRASGSISFLDLDKTVVDRVRLSDIDIDPRHAPVIRHASNLTLSNVAIIPQSGTPEIMDSHGITFENYACPARNTACLTLTGTGNTDIDIRTSGFTPKKVQLTSGATMSALSSD